MHSCLQHVLGHWWMWKNPRAIGLSPLLPITDIHCLDTVQPFPNCRISCNLSWHLHYALPFHIQLLCSTRKSTMWLYLSPVKDCYCWGLFDFMYLNKPDGWSFRKNPSTVLWFCKDEQSLCAVKEHLYGINTPFIKNKVFHKRNTNFRETKSSGITGW